MGGKSSLFSVLGSRGKWSVCATHAKYSSCRRKKHTSFPWLVSNVRKADRQESIMLRSVNQDAVTYQKGKVIRKE